MKAKNVLSLIVVGMIYCWAPVVPGAARAQEKPQVEIPNQGFRKS